MMIVFLWNDICTEPTISRVLTIVGLPGRILRVLTAGNIVKEAGVDAFESTPFSEALGDKDGNIWKTIQAG